MTAPLVTTNARELMPAPLLEVLTEIGGLCEGDHYGRRICVRPSGQLWERIGEHHA